MHKIVRSNESSIPSKQCYFSRVEDQNLRFQGAVSSPVNRIRAQFELHTLQFYGIGLARTSLDKAISDTKQGEKWRGRSVNLTERGKGAAAFEWRDPDLSARNRDVPYNWKQPKVFRLRSTLIGGHHLGKQIDRAQIIIAAISSKSHRDHPRFPTSNRGIEFISESRKKFHAYEKSVSDSNRDGTRRHWRKIGEYFFFIFLLFFFFFYFFYYYYYLLSKEGEERKEGRKNKKKGKKLRHCESTRCSTDSWTQRDLILKITSEKAPVTNGGRSFSIATAPIPATLYDIVHPRPSFLLSAHSLEKEEERGNFELLFDDDASPARAVALFYRRLRDRDIDWDSRNSAKGPPYKSLKRDLCRGGGQRGVRRVGYSKNVPSGWSTIADLYESGRRCSIKDKKEESLVWGGGNAVISCT